MRQVVILETRKAGDGITQVNGFNWYPIATATARIPKPQFVSAGVILDPAHAITAAEQADLESGAVREEVFSLGFASSNTRAQIESELQRRWTDRKAALDAEPAPRQFFGRSWDGTGWTA